MIKKNNKDDLKKRVVQEDASEKLKMSITLTFFTLISFVFIVFDIHSVFAEQTDTINKTKIVSAPIQKVWSIISDVDKNSNYWSIKDIKNINTNSNIIERDVVVPAPPFINPNAHQIITLYPEKSKVVENQTQGPITGVKTITLSQVDSIDNNNKTAINILWNLDLSKIPILGKGFAKDNINKSVDDALNKIEKAL
jgi:carbon monoxide dehydrogenase subunit G